MFYSDEVTELCLVHAAVLNNNGHLIPLDMKTLFEWTDTDDFTVISSFHTLRAKNDYNVNL
jgi:hypothetical protein